MSVLGISYGKIDHPRGTYYVESTRWGNGRAHSVYRVVIRSADGNGRAEVVAMFASRRDAMHWCASKRKARP